MKEKLFIKKLTSTLSFVDFECCLWLDSFQYESSMESPYYFGNDNDRHSNFGFGYYSVNRIRDIILHCYTKS